MELEGETISLMLHRARHTKRIHYPVFISILLCQLSACSEQDKVDIRSVLDARDAAVSNHDIKSYAGLLISGYEYNNQTEFEIINKMRGLFNQFEKIEMTSDNRTIRLLDDQHAECEQSYLLHVQANGEWRQINQRERISLTKTDSGWKISGGL